MASSTAALAAWARPGGPRQLCNNGVSVHTALGPGADGDVVLAATCTTDANGGRSIQFTERATPSKTTVDAVVESRLRFGGADKKYGVRSG